VSRRLKLASSEMGFLELYLIYQYGPDFEPDWLPLQSSPLASLFTVVSKETMNQALQGWTRPLIQQLGLPPLGCLHKIPTAYRTCAHKTDCPFFDKSSCFPTAKKLPNCFQPSGVEDSAARQLGYDVVALWREGVFVIVVQENPT